MSREQEWALSSEAVDGANPVGDRWIFGGLLFLLVWAPLPLGSNRIWAIGLLVGLAVLLLIGTVVVWRRVPQAAMQRLALFKWPLLCLAGFVCLSWLQTIPLPANWVGVISPVAALAQEPAVWMTLSLDVFQSRIMAGLSFAYFAAFIVTAITVRDGARLDRLAQVLVWSGVLQAVVGVVLYSIKAEYILFFSSVSHSNLIGTFINRNHVAAYLNMCLSVGIGLMLARLGSEVHKHAGWKERLKRAIEFLLSTKIRLRLLLVVMVIALVVTRSRMGNSAFFISLMVVGVLGVVLMRKTAPRTIALIVSLVIIDILVVGSAVGIEQVAERIQQTQVSGAVGDSSTEESIEARTEAARTALPMVRDFAWAGSGGGSFYNVFMGYRTPAYGSSFVDHTHNDYVEIAADYGLIGLGFLGLLVSGTLWTVIKVMAQRRSNLPRGIAFGVAMAIVTLLMHSTVDFNLQIPANALTIVVILAMGWIARFLPSPERKPGGKISQNGLNG